MKPFLFLMSMMLVAQCFSQDIPVKRLPSEIFKTVKKDTDTSKWNWKRGGMVNANLSQGSLSNWAAGGDNFSMSINTYVNYFFLHKKKNYSWDNSFDFNLGFVQTTSLGSRKNDDRFDALSKFGYRLDTTNKLYISSLLNLRSQLFDGYTYKGGNASYSSTFLSPAYVLLSVGVDYKPTNYFSLFVSPVTSRWIIIADRDLIDSGYYGVPKGKHVATEVGAFMSANFNRPLGKNVTYRSRLDAFSNYKDKPANIDVFMTNMIAFKINKYLSATYSLDLIYDDDVKIFGKQKNDAALQVKSLIGIGFLMRFVPITRKTDQ